MSVEDVVVALIGALRCWGARSTWEPRAPNEVNLNRAREVLDCAKGLVNGKCGNYADCYARAVESAARIFFRSPPNLLYPMKAMLLLTGGVPAPDSNVRAGAANVRAGCRLSGPPECQEEVKAWAAYAAKWKNAHIEILGEACDIAGQESLASQAGRVLDMVLFLRGKEKKEREK